MANIKSLDLNLLRVFDTLMDERSVSRTAEKLAVSQPAVSGMIGRLRDSLNDRLFIGTHRGIVPTVRAEQLAGPIKKLLTELDAVLQPASFVPDQAELTFSIAATDYSLQAIVEPFLVRLREQAPGIKISVRWLNEQELSEHMQKGSIDLALTTPDTCPPDLRVKRLFEESWACIVREDHPCLAHQPLTLEAFCGLDHAIVSYIGGAFAGVTDEVLRSLNKKRRVVLSVPGFIPLTGILKKSDLCAVVPARLIPGSTGLVALDLPFTVPGFTKVMAWHERTHYSEAHRWIRDLIFAACQADDFLEDQAYCPEY